MDGWRLALRHALPVNRRRFSSWQAGTERSCLPGPYHRHQEPPMADIAETNVSTRGRRRFAAWLLDERFLQVLAQVVFAAVVLLIVYLLYQNMARALAKQGMVLGYNFLNLTSGFDIS